MEKYFYSGEMLVIHYNSYKDMYIVSDLFTMETVSLKYDENRYGFIFDKLIDEMRLLNMSGRKSDNDRLFVENFNDEERGNVMLSLTQNYYNNEIKKHKKLLLNAIENNDIDTFDTVTEWLIDFWDNDNDLFNDKYPFDYSFDEMAFKSIDEVLETTKLENIRKWAL